MFALHVEVFFSNTSLHRLRVAWRDDRVVRRSRTYVELPRACSKVGQAFRGKSGFRYWWNLIYIESQGTFKNVSCTTDVFNGSTSITYCECNENKTWPEKYLLDFYYIAESNRHINVIFIHIYNTITWQNEKIKQNTRNISLSQILLRNSLWTFYISRNTTRRRQKIFLKNRRRALLGKQKFCKCHIKGLIRLDLFFSFLLLQKFWLVLLHSFIRRRALFFFHPSFLIPCFRFRLRFWHTRGMSLSY